MDKHPGIIATDAILPFYFISDGIFFSSIVNKCIAAVNHPAPQ